MNCQKLKCKNYDNKMQQKRASKKVKCKKYDKYIQQKNDLQKSKVHYLKWVDV